MSGFSVDDENNLRLLVDADGNFSNATAIAPTSVGGSVRFAAPAIADGNFFTIGTTSATTPLPIELLQFNAELVDGKVDVTWTTASELTTTFLPLSVQKTWFAGKPLRKWNGAGTSTQPIYYKTIDYQPLTGTSYYRLKQTDFDGQYTYSSARAVNNSASAFDALLAFPNPTTGTVTIKGSEEQLGRFILLSAIGQDVTQKVHLVKRGDQFSPLISETFRLAFYYLQTSTSKVSIVKQ